MSKIPPKITTLQDDTNAPEGAGGAADQAAIAAAEGTKIAGANHDGELSGKRRLVTIHSTETEGGNDAVNVGLNGFMYQIPRGVACNVPEEVLQILSNAKTTTYKTGADLKPVERTQNRFAFSVA